MNKTLRSGTAACRSTSTNLVHPGTATALFSAQFNQPLNRTKQQAHCGHTESKPQKPARIQPQYL